MATKPDRWYFSTEQLRNSPSAKCGTEPEKELSYRQQAANLIQDMGQRLQVYPSLNIFNMAISPVECSTNLVVEYAAELLHAMCVIDVCRPRI